jgi:hypothetical protein
MKKATKKTKKIDTERAMYVAGADNKLADRNDHIIIHLATENDERIPQPASSSSLDMHAAHTFDTPYDSVAFSTSRSVTLLEEFSKKTDAGEWPSETNVACHWCCHPFQGTPVSLPTKMVNSPDSPRISSCDVEGCFCSFQCAAAHNFSTGDSDNMWERYAMLNRLYFDKSIAEGMQPDAIGKVVPAPSRLVLVMFGGHMTIEEFRSRSVPREYLSHHDERLRGNAKFVDVLHTPLSFVPAHVDEINDIDVMQPLKFIPVDQDRIERVKEKLQLKRSKPLVNSPHTLDNVMNLRISHAPE